MRVRFDEFTLDTDTRQPLRGAEAVHLTPKAYELLAKLKSLTNFRAVRDPAAAGGWKIEIGPFPGWKDVPTW